MLLLEGNVVGLLDGKPVGIAVGLLSARDGLIVGRRNKVGVVMGLFDGDAWVRITVGIVVGVEVGDVETGDTETETLLEGFELRALLVG